MARLAWLAFLPLAAAHCRWQCPSPASASTGLKTEPCGGTDTSTTVTALAPGPLTVHWEESINHNGAPFRMALSLDGDYSVDAFEDCVLLDHVPHQDSSGVSYSNEATWTRYAITVDIPDVACDACVLQLMNPMTDKLSGASCTYPPGSCSSVYHSCATVSINGSTPRNDYTCDADPPSLLDTAEFAAEDGVYYKGESGEWDEPWINGTLYGAAYATQAQSVCDTAAWMDGDVNNDDVDDSTSGSARLLGGRWAVGVAALLGALLLG